VRPPPPGRDPAAGLARVEAALVDEPSAVNLLLVKRRALQALGRADEARAVEARLEALSPGIVRGG
jgi:hypothetical protein